jgi:hypothetical protein
MAVASSEPATTEPTGDWDRDTYPHSIGEFLINCTTIAPHTHISADALFNAYVQRCADRRVRAVERTEFFKMLDHCGFVNDGLNVSHLWLWPS